MLWAQDGRLLLDEIWPLLGGKKSLGDRRTQEEAGENIMAARAMSPRRPRKTT